MPSGYEWQCVELVNRLYISRGWIGARWAGNGSDMYTTARAAGLTNRQPQGSINYLAPGDVISYSTGYPGGHAAVVVREIARVVAATRRRCHWTRRASTTT